jgi:glycosyltransferase involved in cell wall biosynthesis
MSFDLIYLEPNSGGYHTGHCKIFLDRVVGDTRVRSIHFAINRKFVNYAGANPVELSGHSPKVSFEYLSEEFVDLVSRHSFIPFRGGIALWNEARRLLTAKPGSICFINMFDAPMFGAMFDRKPMPGVTTGIIHHPPFKLGVKRAPIANACRWILRGIPHYLVSYRTMPLVFTFDEHYLKTLPRFISRHWRVVPDPVPLPRELLLSAFPEAVVSTQSKRTKFLLFGSLGKRKGLGRLLEALHDLTQSEREKIHLVLAGEIREATNEERLRLIQLIESAKQLPGLLLEHLDRYLTEEELIEQLNACEVVLAPYANHIGVSGVILWAAAAGKPIVTQESGWVGHVAREGNLGLTCDTSSPRAVAEALIVAAQPETLKRFEPARLRKFALGHSSGDFYEAIVARLAELGGPLALSLPHPVRAFSEQ